MNATDASPSAPATDPVRPPRPGAAPAGGHEPTPGAVTVLVATARLSLVKAIQSAALVAGLTVVASPDGLHTLMSAVREPPALIILDPDVPGVEADTIQSRLARDARTAGVPVLRLPSRPVDGRDEELPDGHAA